MVCEICPIVRFVIKAFCGWLRHNSHAHTTLSRHKRKHNTHGQLNGMGSHILLLRSTTRYAHYEQNYGPVSISYSNKILSIVRLRTEINRNEVGDVAVVIFLEQPTANSQQPNLGGKLAQPSAEKPCYNALAHIRIANTYRYIWWSAPRQPMPANAKCPGLVGYGISWMTVLECVFEDGTNQAQNADKFNYQTWDNSWMWDMDRTRTEYTMLNDYSTGWMDE